MKIKDKYEIDKIVIDLNQIQSALTSVPFERRHEVLSEGFRMMDLLVKYEQDPDSLAPKQNIKNIALMKFVKNQTLKSNNLSKNSILDPQETYLLNKSGSLGRVLQRSCLIKQQSILQWENKKQLSKKKSLIGFHEKIQQFGGRNNHPLDWVQKSKQNPYRIILIDQQKKDKAIYFKSKLEAQKYFFHFLNQFKIKTNIPSLMDNLNQNFKKNSIHQFHHSLIGFYRSIKQQQLKKISESQAKKKNIDTPERKRQQLERKKQQILQESIIKQSYVKSQQSKVNSPENNYMVESQNINSKLSPLKKQRQEQDSSKGMNDLKKIKTTQIKKYSELFHQLEDSYKFDMFDKWRTKAKSIKMQKLKLNKQIKGSNIQNFPVKQQQFSLCFLGIQFLNITDIFFKPIVAIELVKDAKSFYEAAFNTSIAHKTPHLSYKLIINKGEEAILSKNLNPKNIKHYVLNVKVVDYITFEEVIKDSIVLKNQRISGQSSLMNPTKTFKLQIKYLSPKQSNKSQIANYNQNNSSLKSGIFLRLEPINNNIRLKIKNYWEEQSTKKGYYSIDAKMKVTQILSLGQDKPLSWWLGLDQQSYSILAMLKTASQIIGFKLIKSFLPIINSLKLLYEDLQDLIESVLSIVVNYTYSYFFPQYLHKETKFHIIIGLSSRCDFDSKISIQMSTIDKIFQIQCPQVYRKWKYRNICCGHIMYEYIYELFSRNLPIKVLVQVWNFCFSNIDLIQMYFILLCVWLLRHYQVNLSSCQRLKQVRQILQSKKVNNSSKIIRQIEQLKNKYFTQNKDILSSIKNMFINKPLQKIIYDFYINQTAKIQTRKQNRQLEKNNLLTKYQNNKIIQLPSYPSKKYCLHIYFYKLPTTPGSLFIKSDGIEYECIGYQNTKYYIVSEVTSQIMLKFVNNKSDKYECQLQTIQGVNNFTSYLVCRDGTYSQKKQQKTIQIQYLCGLLTDYQIESIQKNKKFEHYLGSFMSLKYLNDELLRPLQECIFVQQAESKRSDETQKIKSIFTEGSKSFNQIQFYLRWIQNSELTLPEKIELIKNLAQKLSNQHFLSSNKILQKLLLRQFISYTNFPISNIQFQTYYNDCIDCEFNAPKVLKCRFWSDSTHQVNLDQIANNYACERSSQFLYGDLIIDELLQLCRQTIQEILGFVSEGFLSILYSSDGRVNFRKYKVFRKINKEFTVLNDFYEEKYFTEEISKQEPQILMTQVLPTFTKISTILDYVNTTRTVDLKKPKEVRKLAKSVNILKYCQFKLSSTISMRYETFPDQVNIPFLDYYYQLLYKVKIPHLPNVLLNNIRSDIKSICTSNMPMKFGVIKRGQNLLLEKKLGLFGNFRKLSSNPDTVYFWPQRTNEEQKSQNSIKCRAYINYGFGVIRWESCLVKGYEYSVKERTLKSKESKGKTPKKVFLVSYKNKQFYARRYEIDLTSEQEAKLNKIERSENIIDSGKKNSKSFTGFSKFSS